MLLLALLLALGYAPGYGQTVRYVMAGGSGGGSSWVTASGDLQGMVNASSVGDQVWVSAGTYKPTASNDRGISFSMKNGVEIYGGFVGNETMLSQRNWTANPTILSGDIGTVSINTDNSFRIINNSGLGPTAVLDGFTIRDAYNSSSFNGTQGGGMRNNGASPTIRNCIFRNNNIAGIDCDITIKNKK